MEIMINNQISKNLKKFSEVLNNMLNNYENKIEDIDNRLKTLDSQMRDVHLKTQDQYASFQDYTKDESNKPGKDTMEQEFNIEDDEKSSITSALNQLKEKRPDFRDDYEEGLVKFVEVNQKGRSTACQPTIRESPNYIHNSSNLPSQSRKSSIPSSFFNKNTRNRHKTPIDTFTTRHYSTERTACPMNISQNIGKLL
jgi:chaperonin cofactor prefoldin